MKRVKLVISGHYAEKAVDFGYGPLIFHLLVQFWLSGAGQMCGFRAFPALLLSSILLWFKTGQAVSFFYKSRYQDKIDLINNESSTRSTCRAEKNALKKYSKLDREVYIRKTCKFNATCGTLKTKALLAKLNILEK